ncbi:MAG: MmpS family transport accessory protein [Mycobacterium sp.]
MTDSPGPGSPYQRPASPYDGPTDQFPNSYPAYSGYSSSSHQPNPTEQLPRDWAYATQNPQPPPPPQSPRSKTPKWLWVLAGAAVTLVIGLVGALVISGGSDTTTNRQTPSVSADDPTFTEPTTTPTPTPTTRSTTTSPTPSPPADTSTPLLPTETSSSGVTEAVQYEVTGEGRALNITYVGTDNVMQTDYNVSLPWSTEVTLEEPANEVASVVVVNVGREVSCSVSVAGVVVSSNTGSGVTVCSRAIG